MVEAVSRVATIPFVAFVRRFRCVRSGTKLDDFFFFFVFAGKLYAVFGKRHGRIVSTENAHGFGGQFRVLATLPVLESFHLARELRTQTSGLASPQLVFSHWEVSYLRDVRGGGTQIIKRKVFTKSSSLRVVLLSCFSKEMIKK